MNRFAKDQFLIENETGVKIIKTKIPKILLNPCPCCTKTTSAIGRVMVLRQLLELCFKI